MSDPVVACLRGVGVVEGEQVSGRVLAGRTVERVEVIDAASELFVQQGSAGTSMSQIAERAGVAERTVYVRFDTKASLLVNAINAALVGDTSARPVAARHWYRESLTAPTAPDRIALAARVARQLFERAGSLLEAAAQAEGNEPDIAQAAQAIRVEALQNISAFWHAMRDDGLLSSGIDLQWLIVTTAILGSPDTYVQIIRLHHWDLDAYQTWLEATWTHLSTDRSTTPMTPVPGARDPSARLSRAEQ